MSETKVNLGDEVKDLVTGYTGIAVARIKSMNGCIQYTIVARKKKKVDDLVRDYPTIDEQSLKVIKRNAVPSTENSKEEEKIARHKSGGLMTFRRYN